MTPFDIEGRYYKNNIEISKIFSEENYYKECMTLELEYLVSVLEGGVEIDRNDIDFIIKCVGCLCDNKDLISFIKKSEVETRHDIISVCNVLKEFLKEMHRNGFSKDVSKYVHFGLTSQDIVSTVNAKQILDANNHLKSSISKLLNDFNNVFGVSTIKLMPSFTHGRYAVPMSPKHVYDVYSSRILAYIKETPSLANMGDMRFATGAVGNNISMSMLNIDSSEYVRSSTLNRYFTTLSSDIPDTKRFFFQNDNYPTATKSMSSILSLSNVLLDMAQDMWLYCSKDYIIRHRSGNESGSSAMPQKINPIAFENAIGNLKLAIGMSKIYVSELERSMLQRDLSDVTMMRNIGLVYSYVNQAVFSMSNGFEEYYLNRTVIKNDVEGNVQMFSEYIQLYLKLHTDIDGYELMKDISSKKSSWTYIELLNDKEFLTIPIHCKNAIGDMLFL